MFYSAKPTQDRRWQVVNTKTGGLHNSAFDTLEDAQDLTRQAQATLERLVACRGGGRLTMPIPPVALRHRHNHRIYPACGSQRSPE